MGSCGVGGVAEEADEGVVVDGGVEVVVDGPLEGFCPLFGMALGLYLYIAI